MKTLEEVINEGLFDEHSVEEICGEVRIFIKQVAESMMPHSKQGDAALKELCEKI